MPAAKKKPISKFSAGDAAPEFARIKPAGGKSLVLYFYPKDDTPGCTIEAKDFTTLKNKFDKLGVVVRGVSKDSQKSHDKFIDKHCLTIDLISDEDGSLCDAYGVWVEKSMYGKKYMGIERATFLIDAKGIIRQVWNKVSVTNHAQEVLEAASVLQK